MPRAKSLYEHVRDRTFTARRHGKLLEGPLVAEKALRALQAQWQATDNERARRAIAVEFEHAVRDETPPVVTGENVSAAAASESVADFFARHFRHTKGPRAGRPFVLEPWQTAFVDEFYRVDEEGRRIYRLGLLGVPRGNGKSPLAAGLALYELLARTDSPDVFVAAASRDQARTTFNFARSFVEGGDLHERVQVGRNELVYPEAHGSMRVLSADGALQYGLSPSAIIVDELHSFTTPKREELWAAMETALPKRLDSFLLAITTAGSDRLSLLGKLFESMLARLEVEHAGDYLTVGRDEESGTLLWWYAAPEQADVDDERVWRGTNPASWVDLRDLRRQRHRPGSSESSFRRLHLNQWAAGEETWIPPETWAVCEDREVDVPEGEDVYVGIDASITRDATAVSVAHVLEDGRIALRAHVWSAVPETAAHTYLTGGRIRHGDIVDHVLGLAERFRVVEVGFDPSYFHGGAETLSDAGLLVIPIDQKSRLFNEAKGAFYEAVNSAQIAHDGDPVLAAHVTAAAAGLDAHGQWRIYKKAQTRKIDGLYAAIIAHSRAQVDESVYDSRGLIVL